MFPRNKLEEDSSMDAAIQQVLAEYEQRGAEEYKRQLADGVQRWIEQRDQFLISVGPATGQVLNILAKSVKARTILELGTSYGYSTVWLAEAARANGGKLFTLDVADYKQAYARERLARAGLLAYVEFRVGDARETLQSLEGPFDFVLLDLWKDLYIACFDLFYSKLSPGAFIAADNMIYPDDYREMAQAYRRHVRAKPKIDSVLLPIGSGVELSRYADSLA
jgi:predicted O-methyltransferase YrrM